MNIRQKITIVFLAMIVPSVVIGILSIFQLNQISLPVKQKIPVLIQELTKTSELEKLSQSIQYYDEVLTQSARNYAFTGNSRWINIYNESATKLEQAIADAIKLGDDSDKIFFQEIENANQLLVSMEEESINLVNTNQKNKAIKLLESDEYWRQKEIYKSGLTKFVDRRGAQYNQALSTSTESLRIVTNDIQELVSSSTRQAIGVVIISIITAILFGISTAYIITKPISILKKTVIKISQGDVDERVDINSNDEIGQLSTVFNNMADKLQQNQFDIEQKIAKRTVDLEKANHHMIDREIKMIELKKQLHALQSQLNHKS